MSNALKFDPEECDMEHDTDRVQREVVFVSDEAETASAEEHSCDGKETSSTGRDARRSRNPLRRIFSGTILLSDKARRNYPYLLTIAAMFFLNIVVLFWSLHLDMLHLRLEREVQKLRERSIRLEEQRFQQTSHSRIVEELARRGIAIQDPVRPAEKIE